jgi:hypothetical protein
MSKTGRFSRSLAVCCGLGLVVMAGSPAFAQDEEDLPRFDVQQLHPSPSQTTDYFGVYSGQMMFPGQWTFGVFGNYADDPLVLRQADGDRVEGRSIVSDQFTMSILGGIGIADIFELGVAVPLIVSQSGDPLSSATFDASQAEFSVGDVRVVPKLRLVSSEDPRDQPVRRWSGGQRVHPHRQPRVLPG